MASLEKRLEKAQARREERLLAMEKQKKAEPPPKQSKVLPSQQGAVGGPGMLDNKDRKAKMATRHNLTTTKPIINKRAPTTALNFNIGDKSRIAPKVYRQPSYWDAQGGGFQAKRRGPGKTTEAVGFKLGNRDRVNLRPQWATKMIEAGFDPMTAVQGLTADEVAAYLEDEGQMYQLSEAEINQLKNLVEMQLLMESDPELGTIEGSDEVMNLMARLAAVGGDLTELHPADQNAILCLIQFSNIVPGFGPMFDEDAIEASIEGANNFVQYTDHTGVAVFIRKGSYVKAQILERKLEAEIIASDQFNKMCMISIMAMTILYFILKAFTLFYVAAMTGECAGFYQAMTKVEDMNVLTPNKTINI